MTRKDFALIAAAMKQAKPQLGDSPDIWRQWDRDVTSLANALPTANAGFNRTRFLIACAFLDKDGTP